MAEINSAEDTDGEFVIKLTDDIEGSMARVTSGKTVRIIGGGHTIYVNSYNTDSSLGVNNATLNLGTEDGLDTLIIKAGSHNSQSLVIISNGTVNMYDGVQLRDNRASTATSGTGVCVKGGTFNMHGGIIENCVNTATYGGGVYVNEKSTFNMYGGEIKNNQMVKGSYGIGAGVFNLGTFNMSDGTISGNTATYDSSQPYGAGVCNAGTFTMSGGTISGNTATYGGGVYTSCAGIYRSGSIVYLYGSFEMTGGEISGNTATYGGGVYNNGKGLEGCTFAMSNGTISGNTATYGGGVYNNTDTLFDMTDSIVSDNTATGYGGGVYNAGTFNMSDCTVSGNTAKSYGGGVYSNGANAAVNMSDSTISGNSTTGYGAGVYNGKGSFNMSGGSISDNVVNNAKGAGGGIFNNGATFKMVDAAVCGNTGYMGGGVYSCNLSTFVSAFEMTDSTISGNTAVVGGGVFNIGNSFKMIGGKLCENTATLTADDIYHSYGNGGEDSMILPANTSWQLDSAEAREEGAEEVFYNGRGIQADEGGQAFLKANLPASKIAVVFSPVTEGSNKYYIILKSLERGKRINGYMSCDLAFKNEVTDHIIYDIEAAENMDVTLTSESEISKEYHFEMKGEPISSVTDEAIIIGIVTFNGYGTFKFNVDTEYKSTHSINIVNTTMFADHIVDYYTVEGGTILVNDKSLMGDNIADNEYATIIGELKPPTKTLTINVTFPNAVSDNAAAYQKMQLVISGGDIKPEDADKHIFDLGNDNALVVWDDTAKAYTITDVLTEDIAYTVTVSGAGYRTARYMVLMDDDKTITFWNNVMDNAVEIETGKPKSAREITFLAGDIVKDNDINLYDLSAVVSYFGTDKLVAEHPEYAKYDLNRDGVIDSKDVAYVLVSWGR